MFRWNFIYFTWGLLHLVLAPLTRPCSIFSPFHLFLGGTETSKVSSQKMNMKVGPEEDLCGEPKLSLLKQELEL